MLRDERVVSDPVVCHGKPCIRGTRVMVSVIVDSLAAGESAEEIARAFHISVVDVKAAQEYANEEWDRQIESDVAAGRLDKLANKAIQDFENDRCTDLLSNRRIDQMRATQINDNKNIAEMLQQIISRLRNALSPAAIYLYGSYAYGTPGPGSDIDLLVVVEQSDLTPHQRDAVAYRSLGDIPVPIDVQVYTQAEFDQRSALTVSFERTVRTKGRLVHAA